MKKTAHQHFVLLGRDKELENLRIAWSEAASGQPQIRILAGEPGYGKTRLVQAFYAWLSANHDPENFWPESLVTEQQSHLVAPNVDGQRGKITVPWFWWGLYWREDTSGPGPLIASIHESNFVSLQNAILQPIKEKQAVRDVLVQCVKIVINLVGGALVGDLLDAYDQVRCCLGIQSRHKDGIDLASGKQVAEAQAADRVLTTFALMLDQSRRWQQRPIPVILILDDAHWMDELSLNVVESLWLEATKQGWPLLIIATTRLFEWNKKRGLSSSEKLNAENNSKSVQLVTLGRLKDEEIENLLGSAFPGLPSHQKTFFVAQASGNPSHTAQIITHLKGLTSDWFESGDAKRGLTDAAFAIAQAKRFAIEALEKDRFDSADLSVRDALGAASTQGEVFISHFALEVAAKLGLTVSDPKSLAMAENPYALAETLESDSMRFRSRCVHGLAYEHITQRHALRGVTPPEFEDKVHKAIFETALSWRSSERLKKLPNNVANRILEIAAESAGTASNKVCAAAEALAFFAQDHSGWFLAAWKLRWLELRASSNDLRLIAKNVPTDVLRDAAKALWKAGEKKEGLEVALEVERRASNSEDPSERARYLILATYMKGELQCATFEEISRGYLEAIRLRETAALSKGDPKSWRRLARTHHAFGCYLLSIGKQTKDATTQVEARKQFQAAVDVARTVVARSGRTPREKYLLELAFYLRELAEFLRHDQEYFADAVNSSAESVSHYREVIEVYGRSLEKIKQLTYALLTQASVTSGRGQYKQAVEIVDVAIKELESLHKYGVTPTSFRLYEFSLKAKADFLLKSELKQPAVKSLQTALKACKKALTLTPGHPELEKSRTALTKLIVEVKG